MIKYIMAPFGSWFIMLAWAAGIGNIIDYFEPKNLLLEEYILILQGWIFVCIMIDIKKFFKKTLDK